MDNEPSLDAIEQELDSINLMRTTDAAGYRKNEAVQERERVLIEQREKFVQDEGRKTQLKSIAKVFTDHEDEDNINPALMKVQGWEAGHLVSEMQRPTPEVEAPASQDEIEQFAENPMQAELLKEWGNQAPMKLAILKARLARMMDINPQGIQELIDTASEAELKSIFRRLSK